MRAIAEPNYDNSCEVCDMSPTVCIVEGENQHDTCLCGLCWFGTEQALDEHKWNNLE